MKYKETEIGNIPKHWEVFSIDEIGEVVGGGTPSTKKEEYYGGSIPWITPKDLSGYSKMKIKVGERSITESGLKGSSARLLPKNAVLLSSRAPIGYVVIADNPLATNQGFKSVICNLEKVIPEYLYYVLKTSKDKLESISSGSTFKEVSGKAVKGFKIALPPIIEQNKITEILNSLDTKIELNNDIIYNFEQLAQTIFKRWFIDFEFPNENGDSYLSSGGKMVESELGMIPKGWELREFSNICSVKDGTHDSPKSVEDGYPLVTSKHLMGNRIDFSTTKYVSKLDFEKINIRSKVDRFDILISMIGTVGRLYLVQNEKIEFAIKNVGLFKTSEVLDKYEYLYCHLKSDYITNHIIERLAGSTQQYISLTELRKLPVLIPNDNTLDRFKKIVNPLFNKIYSKTMENDQLLELRDTLLPKLLSGEIEIPSESEALEHVQL